MTSESEQVPKSHDYLAREFAGAARALCTTLEAPMIDLEVLVVELSLVQDLAAVLPAVERSDAEYPRAKPLNRAWRSVFNNVGDAFGSDRIYYSCGASDGDEMVGDVRDDLADVYKDLQHGLAIVEDSPADAIWEWRFSFETHWGGHAREALRVLQGDHRPLLVPAYGGGLRQRRFGWLRRKRV